MATEMNEIMVKEKDNAPVQTPFLDSFMKAGKITVFESGLERPETLQERPFMGTLPKGQTTFIDAGEKPSSYRVQSAEEKAMSPALDTEAHKFFEEMENRFRTVMPGVTLFIIDPDAVQGQYLMDKEADRSLSKSLYMFVENKLQKAAAGNDQTFLTQDEVLQSVSEAGITDRNPFSMRAAVAPTIENMAGLGNVNLVVGDNPDATAANVLDMVLGAEERRVLEGVTHDEFRRLVLYHELGHATDHNYASACTSIDKVVETPLDNVMQRHRTECIADAHAVLQLARDFGNTKCAELWGDCRIEYLRISVDRRLEDTKYDSEFMAKLNEADRIASAINPEDPDYEKSFKELMANKNVADVVKKLGSPLAYHTTDVIDATVKWAHEHLADGSLQKMTDLEVIKQAQEMSETYGFTRQEMAEISISLAKGETHPRYDQMMDRVQVARDNMPIDNKELDKQYELQRELNAYISEAQLCANLGLPAPEQHFSKELSAKLVKDNAAKRDTQQEEELSVMLYQNDLFDVLDNTSTREEIHTILGQEKEDLRTAGKTDVGEKDEFAASKLKVVDAVIEQIPNVEAMIYANKRVKTQVEEIPSSTEVSGDAAIVHFIKSEMRIASAMSSALVKAYDREPEKMTMDDHFEALRSEHKDFKKALRAEKEAQIAAFAIRADKEAWNKVSTDPVLADLIDQKAKRKPTATLASYQMMVGSPDKEQVKALLQETQATHQYITEAVSSNKDISSTFQKKDMRTFKSLSNYAKNLKEAEQKKSPLNLKGFALPKKKSVIDIALQQNKSR